MGREAVCFLLHFPWPRGRWALPITVSYGARTFLPSTPSCRVSDKFTSYRPAAVRPTLVLHHTVYHRREVSPPEVPLLHYLKANAWLLRLDARGCEQPPYGR